MKKLLLLGGSSYLKPVIEAAHKLGVYVITCDYLPDNIAHKYSDEYCNVSIIDKEAVLKLAKELQIDGIMSFATDPGVMVASYVAEQMGLPGSPYESVKILQNKNLFRDFLEKNGFNVPKHESFEDKAEALKVLVDFPMPAIVKPVDSAGSKGVRKVTQFSELEEAIDYALKYSYTNKFIIEEFIEKQGHSSDTDCFSVNNELVYASFNCQYFDENAENPYTPAAYCWPSTMPLEAQRELREELQRLISLLNMGTTIYNVETRVGKNGKPYIMECSPRAGGNRLSEMLKNIDGQDLVLNNVKSALGMEIDGLKDPQYSATWAEYILHSNKSGVVQHIEIQESFAKEHIVEQDIWVKAGDKVQCFTGANETIGTLVLRFDNQEQADYYLKNEKEWLEILVE